MIEKFNKYLNLTRLFFSHYLKRTSLDDMLRADQTIIGKRAVYSHYKSFTDLKSIFGAIPIDQKALDFGCGIGRDIVGWNRYIERIDGCDFNVDFVRLCKENLNRNLIRNNKIYLTGLSLDQLPMDYDIVYSRYVFQHIALKSLRRHYLKQIINRLKKGGNFFYHGGFGRVSSHFRHRTVNYDNDKIPEWASYCYSYVFVNDVRNIVDDMANVGFQNIEYYYDANGIPDLAFERILILKGTK